MIKRFVKNMILGVLVIVLTVGAILNWLGNGLEILGNDGLVDSNESKAERPSSVSSVDALDVRRELDFIKSNMETEVSQIDSDKRVTFGNASDSEDDTIVDSHPIQIVKTIRHTEVHTMDEMSDAEAPDINRSQIDKMVKLLSKKVKEIESEVEK